MICILLSYLIQYPCGYRKGYRDDKCRYKIYQYDPARYFILINDVLTGHTDGDDYECGNDEHAYEGYIHPYHPF